MRIRRSIVSGLLLLLFCGIVHAGEESGPEEVKLKPDKLDDAGLFVSKDDVRVPGETYEVNGKRFIYPQNVRPFNIAKGCILTKNYSSTSPKVDFGQSSATIDLPKASIEINGDKEKLKATKQAGLKTIDFELPNKQKYGLAFPYAQGKVCYVRSGTLLEGKVGSAKFTIYDSDFNTQYDLSKDTYAPEGSRVFVPLGKALCTKKDVLVPSALSATGESITLEPYKGETGEVQLKFNKVEGYGGLSDAKGEVWCSLGKACDTMTVPVGTYKPQYGFIYSKKEKFAIAGFKQGEAPDIEVKAGKKTKVEYGAPFALSFTPTVNNGKIEIAVSSLRLHGSQKEEYFSFEYDGAPAVSLGKTPLGNFETG